MQPLRDGARADRRERSTRCAWHTRCTSFVHHEDHQAHDHARPHHHHHGYAFSYSYAATGYAPAPYYAAPAPAPYYAAPAYAAPSISVRVRYR